MYQQAQHLLKDRIPECELTLKANVTGPFSKTNNSIKIVHIKAQSILQAQPLPWLLQPVWRCIYGTCDYAYWRLTWKMQLVMLVWKSLGHLTCRSLHWIDQVWCDPNLYLCTFGHRATWLSDNVVEEIKQSVIFKKEPKQSCQEKKCESIWMQAHWRYECLLIVSRLTSC